MQHIAESKVEAESLLSDGDEKIDETNQSFAKNCNAASTYTNKNSKLRFDENLSQVMSLEQKKHNDMQKPSNEAVSRIKMEHCAKETITNEDKGPNPIKETKQIKNNSNE